MKFTIAQIHALRPCNMAPGEKYSRENLKKLFGGNSIDALKFLDLEIPEEDRLWVILRLDFLPDIPTVTESGIPDYEVSGWYGLFAPSGTPREVVARLNAEVARILRLPDVKERFSRAGMRPVGNSQDEFVSYMKSEVAKWRRAVEITGVKGGSL